MFKNFLDDFYDILFNYRKGLSRIANDRNIWQGLLVYLIVTVVVALANFEMNSSAVHSIELLPPELVIFFPPRVLEAAAMLLPLSTMLLQVIFGPLYFLLLVAVLHFVSVLFGGSGRASGLGAVLGYAYLPYLLVALGGLLELYTMFNITAILTAGAFFWSLWLRIAGIKGINGFSWGRSVLVYFIPLLVLLAALVFFILLVIVFLIPLLVQFWEGYM